MPKQTPPETERRKTDGAACNDELVGDSTTESEAAVAAAARNTVRQKFFEDFGLGFDAPFTVDEIQDSVEAYLRGDGVFSDDVDKAA